MLQRQDELPEIVVVSRLRCIGRLPIRIRRRYKKRPNQNKYF